MFAHLNERIGEGTAAVRRSNLTIIYANPAFRSMLGLSNDVDLSERVIVSLFDLASGDFIRNIASGHEEIDTSLELHASVRKEGELGLASIFVSTYIKSFGDTLLFTLRDQSSSGGKKTDKRKHTSSSFSSFPSLL
jgi:PAS domain-containing protein